MPISGRRPGPSGSRKKIKFSYWDLEKTYFEKVKKF